MACVNDRGRAPRAEQAPTVDLLRVLPASVALSSRHFLVAVESDGGVTACEVAPRPATPVGEAVTEHHGDCPQRVCQAALSALAAVMPDEPACDSPDVEPVTA